MTWIRCFSRSIDSVRDGIAVRETIPARPAPTIRTSAGCNCDMMTIEECLFFTRDASEEGGGELGLQVFKRIKEDSVVLNKNQRNLS